MMSRVGHVYYEDIYAGDIIETDDGFVFNYDEEYLISDNPAISLTMSKKKKSYFSKVLFPFFDGLIPEGYLLDLAISKWSLDRKDRMGILLKVCRDTIGAVSVRGEDNEK